jgi:hypothetical protein
LLKLSQKKYKKKPIVIEAIEWTGKNLKSVIDFIGMHPSAKKWTWTEYESVVKDEGLKIFTLEGTMMADIGDYIIKGVEGEYYPCKPNIFKATYEEVTENKLPRIKVGQVYGIPWNGQTFEVKKIKGKMAYSTGRSSTGIPNDNLEAIKISDINKLMIKLKD